MSDDMTERLERAERRLAALEAALARIEEFVATVLAAVEPWQQTAAATVERLRELELRLSASGSRDREAPGPGSRGAAPGGSSP